jgi:hypothetical protein
VGGVDPGRRGGDPGDWGVGEGEGKVGGRESEGGGVALLAGEPIAANFEDLRIICLPARRGFPLQYLRP